MAKPGRKPKHITQGGSTAPDSNGSTRKRGRPPGATGENISGYFRAVFMENPRLLKERSNEVLLRRWLADHPGESEVPQGVKNVLSNLKSVHRRLLRTRAGRNLEEAAALVPQPGPEAELLTGPSVDQGLEQLEELIDDCMTFAKNLDRGGLERVLTLLRRARNAVVWKLGQ
jgi:hypothetical protein